jgi:transglutaminase-like putative cysteine protease
MVIESTEDLSLCLEPTYFCDCENQKILDMAHKLTKECETDKEKALNIFYFVRDEIPFMIDYIVKASETLEKRYGFCVTKATLQIALLRAAGIPAKYHLAHAKKESLKGVIARGLYNGFPDIVTFHTWPECCLNDRWISCDALFDELLTKAIFKKGILSKEKISSIDWDGETDLNIAMAWLIKDKGSHASLDDLFRKVQKNFNPDNLPIEIINYSNNYTERLRKKV